MIRLAAAAFVLLIVTAACGDGDSSGRPTPSAEEQRVLELIAEERAVVEAITPAGDAEEETTRAYLNRLEFFELGVMTSTSVAFDICNAGLPIEREALAQAQAEQAGPSAWDRYEALLDEIEAFLCSSGEPS